MELTPREKDKLLIFTAALLAERRKAKGLKLNYVEAVAYISAAILEGAREGRSVSELMNAGAELLDEDDVMPGVSELIPEVQVEATFADGTKLVTVHAPIRPGRSATGPRVVPGEIQAAPGEIEINSGRRTVTVTVKNRGDRPIQVGSHYHFYETNSALDFDRERTRGHRLNIASGTAVRFEPGQEREVELVEYGGQRQVFGFNARVMGQLDGSSNGS